MIPRIIFLSSSPRRRRMARGRGPHRPGQYHLADLAAPGSGPGQALQPGTEPGRERRGLASRANKLAITVFDTYDDIVDACCKAWNFLANDPKAIASITSREWAKVS